MTAMLGATPDVTGPVHYSGTLGTSDAALCTASGAGVILGGIFAQNVTNSDAQLTLTMVRASGAVESLVTGLTVAAGTAGPVIDDAAQLAYFGVLLRSGDALHGSASAPAAISVVAYE
jgi:hypothetical protein